MHRKIALLVAIAAFAIAAPAFAQETTQQINKAAIEAQKKAIVANNLPLTDEEEKAFWPVYEEYQKALEAQMKEEGQLIESYAEAYGNLDDAKAKELLDGWMKNQESAVQLRQDYLPKFEKVLPATKVIRYYQIENKIDAIVDFEVAAVIPLAQ